MNRITTLLSILLLLAAVPMASAAPVDALAASEAALQFVTGSKAAGSMKAAANPASLQLIYSEPSVALSQAVDYYVFYTGDGFVIVAGDDRAQAVLAYGDGALDMSGIPCNLKWMLDHYAEQIEWLHAHPAVRVEAPFTSTTVVEPLLPCTWSQGKPYYDQCPLYHGEYCATGCIATAMAQVMYYWKFPDTLPALPAYTSRSYNIFVPALPGTTLDWDNMLDAYYFQRYTAVQGEAVATLMRYCGQGSSMDYGADGSGAGCWNQMVAMHMFGYNLSSQLLHRDDYGTDEWNALMLEDLADGIPILYSGYDVEAGHAYVVDGFDGIMYHINWGWEGSGNGYFALDAFSVGSMDFSFAQEMQHRLYPEIYTGPYDLEADGLYYKINGNEATVTYSTPTFNSYRGQVTIPSQVNAGGVNCTVTAIGNNAFRDCYQLTHVTLPPTLRHIGKYAFKNCVNLTSLSLPDAVVSIDYAAFQDCSSLSTLSLGNGLEQVGLYAFENCSGLKQLTVPSSVKSIGDYAFVWCSGLTRVDMTSDPGIDLEDYDYDGCEIGYGAFACCINLREVGLGDGVVGIGESAFNSCVRLDKVTLGLTMDHIDTLAFHNCPSLSRIIAMPELPPDLAGVNCFDDVHYATTRVVVPAFARDNYICDDMWTRFENLVNLEDEMVPGDVNGDSEVNIADVNAIIDMILAGTSSATADVNGDGEINIADVNAIIDLILAK